MSQLSMSEMTTYRWSFEEDVAQYAAAGFAGIGVWRQKLSDCGEAKGIELLAESGLAVSNLLWAGGFTGSDGRTLLESIDDAASAIRLAARMRAGSLVVYSGSRGGHTHSHARRLVREALSKLAPIAEEFNVPLALESMHPGCAADWTYLTSLEETAEVLDQIGSPSLKMVLDTYHLGLQPCAAEQIGQYARQIAIVHLGDGHLPRESEQCRTPLGEGDVPLKEIVAALTAAGYDGWYDIELIGPDVETADYQQLLCQSKQAFAQLQAVTC